MQVDHGSAQFIQPVNTGFHQQLHFSVVLQRSSPAIERCSLRFTTGPGKAKGFWFTEVGGVGAGTGAEAELGQALA